MPRGAHALIGANRSGRFEMGRGTRIEYRGVCVCVVLALLCCCECVRGSLRFPSRTPIGAGEVGIGWKEDESATPASAAHGSDSEDEPSRVRRQTVSGKKGGTTQSPTAAPADEVPVPADRAGDTWDAATSSITSGRVDNPLAIAALVLVGGIVIFGAVLATHRTCRKRSTGQGDKDTPARPSALTTASHSTESVVDYLDENEVRSSVHTAPVYACDMTAPPPSYTATVESPRTNAKRSVVVVEPTSSSRRRPTGVDYRESTPSMSVRTVSTSGSGPRSSVAPSMSVRTVSTSGSGTRSSVDYRESTSIVNTAFSFSPTRVGARAESPLRLGSFSEEGWDYRSAAELSNDKDEPAYNNMTELGLGELDEGDDVEMSFKCIPRDGPYDYASP